jgi:hypothetical protein
MEQKLVDSILSEFDKLPHGEQVDLFLQIRSGLLKLREVRRKTHLEGLDVAKCNIEALDSGDTIIISPDSIKAS